MPVFSSYFDRFNLVKQFPIFSKLNWFELQKIAHHSNVVEYKKGETICRRGDPPDNLYCVVSGRIQAYLENEQGPLTNVEFIHRGMFFGIISLLTGEGHSLSFRAINDSVVLQIKKNDFHNILKTVPQLGVLFSRSLSQRLRKRTTAAKTIFESTIVSVYSPVKGTGSSTYAVYLALSLQRETGKKVIFLNIVSSKPRTPGPSGLSSTETLTWKQASRPLHEIIDEPEKILTQVRKADGIAVDRLNVHFDPDNRFLRRQISQFVTALVNDYHYIVVDLPTEMDDIVMETLTQSDLIHLVTQDAPDNIRLTRQVLEKLENTLKENFRADQVHVLVCGEPGKEFRDAAAVNRELDFDTYSRLDFIRVEEFSTILDAPDLSLRLPHPDCVYAQVIRKVSRRIGNILVGLVLGGGAALGLSHIGVLKVLEEEKIPVDIIAGSSMGALIAGLWATGHTSQDIARIAAEFENRKNFFKLVDPIFPVSGFIGGLAIRRWLSRKLGARTFYETRIPLKIVAYDLMRRQELVIDSGSIVEAIHRSIAIPGIMRPVIEQDRVVIDGGVLNPLPTNVLSALGVNKIIAVNVLQSPEDVVRGSALQQQRTQETLQVPFLRHPWIYLGSRIAKVMKNIFSPSISDIIVYSLQASEYVIAQQSAVQADVLIHPDLSGFNWFEINRSREFIRKGEEAARQAMTSIRHLIGS